MPFNTLVRKIGTAEQMELVDPDGKLIAIVCWRPNGQVLIMADKEEVKIRHAPNTDRDYAKNANRDVGGIRHDSGRE